MTRLARQVGSVPVGLETFDAKDKPEHIDFCISLEKPWSRLHHRIARRRPIMDLLAEQTADEFDHGARGEAPVVQKRIEFDQIERTHQT